MKNYKHLLLISAFWCGANSTFAQAWMQCNVANTNWFSVCSSADGSILFAVGGTTNEDTMYTSTNSGASWKEIVSPLTNSLYGIATSADGNTLFASRRPQGSSGYYVTNSNPFFLSTNSGNTWISLMDPITNRLHGIAISADGRTLIGGMAQGIAYSSTQGWVYISTNSGATWSSNLLSSSSGPVLSMWAFSSADGSRLSAVLLSILGGKNIFTFWTTTNSGTTWAQSVLPWDGPPFYSAYVWSAMASSANGKKWVAVGSYNYYTQPAICISTNGGASWNARTVSLSGLNYLNSIASSADGSKLLTTGGNAPIYVSTDSGTTWSAGSAPVTNWNGIASSADFCKLVAAVDSNFNKSTASGGIWTTRNIPAPSMNIISTNGCFQAAWVLPSTNFVMQQSVDLWNWADMTNHPVLNFANLQDEVILSPPGGIVFYRLKTP